MQQSDEFVQELPNGDIKYKEFGVPDSSWLKGGSGKLVRETLLNAQNISHLIGPTFENSTSIEYYSLTAWYIETSGVEVKKYCNYFNFSKLENAQKLYDWFDKLTDDYSFKKS